ncbi:Rieske 2Fe-2S domain-containing protein [Streptomyces sp. MNP-20]|uniref:Rieske 2Fe-2S domain-containing protein n=1 Tax=Streptomyces sp. MNP-20 TaxID=2721165 RepID=UPI0035C79A73
MDCNLAEIRDRAIYASGRESSRRKGFPVTSISTQGYPTGWFALDLSRRIAPGTVRRARLMGEEVIIFRTVSGQLAVSTAYCPHRGAHLGYGGKVQGEELICPFHNFKFASDGACIGGRNSAARITARLNTYPSVENDGMVYCWWHPSEPVPTWNLPKPAILSAAQSAGTGVLNGSAKEIVESFFDDSHYSALHGITLDDIVESPSSDGVRMTAVFAIRDTLPLLRHPLEAKISAYGMGFTSTLLTIPGVDFRAEIRILPTPIGPWDVKLWVTTRAILGSQGSRPPWLLSALGGCGAARFLHWGMWYLMRADRVIWRHKSRYHQPSWATTDVSNKAFHFWSAQFFID